MALLSREIQSLPLPDRVLLRRRFFEQATIASIARDTAQDPKLLYRRVARLLAELRDRLEGQGVSAPEEPRYYRARPADVRRSA